MAIEPLYFNSDRRLFLLGLSCSMDGALMSLALNMFFYTFSLKRQSPKNVCLTQQTPDLIGVTGQFLNAYDW